MNPRVVFGLNVSMTLISSIVSTAFFAGRGFGPLATSRRCRLLRGVSLKLAPPKVQSL